MRIKHIMIMVLLAAPIISTYSQKIEWTAKASLPNRIYSGSAVTCQDKIFFIGGQIDQGSGNYVASDKLFEYDLIMDIWTEKTGMPTARFNTAVAAVDGKVYVFGGDRFLAKNEMYDPATDSWQTLSPMPTARQHIKAAVVDDKIYIIGGLESWQKVSKKNEMYDPQTDTWEVMAPVPTSKHNYSAITYDGKIYLFGGSTQNGGDVWLKTSSVEVYDPESNTWSTSTALPAKRFNPGIGLLGDKILITGGFSDDEVVSDVDVFDPVSLTWSEATALPEKNVAMGSATLNDKIYIIGGTSGPAMWKGYNRVYEGTLDESTGTAQNSISDELLIFPNPAKEYIEIVSDKGDLALRDYQLVTMAGSLVKEGSLESERIAVSDLKRGVFMLRIRSANSIITRKIVIVH